MANAVKTKKPTKQAPTKKTESSQESPWYVFCSQGCGFCKKAEPVIEELNNEGYNIVKLDVAEGDNQKLAEELKKEYNTQCGTPWFINADTGKGICGFREKDVLEKWLAGEDIPEPPRPTGAPPKPPFQGSKNKENITWKKEYKQWLKDNQHMPKDWLDRQQSADKIIDGPRPKSDAPRPTFLGPQLSTTTDADIDSWGEKLKVWQEENKHLPNLQPVEKIVENFKQRRDQMKNQPNPNQPNPNQPIQSNTNAGTQIDNTQLNTMDARVQALEVKIDKIINHFGVK